MSTKFCPQINSAEEEPKTRNFHGVDGISNTVHPLCQAASIPEPAGTNHTSRVDISTKRWGTLCARWWLEQAPVKLLVRQGCRGAVTDQEHADGEDGWLAPQTAGWRSRGSRHRQREHEGGAGIAVVVTRCRMPADQAVMEHKSSDLLRARILSPTYPFLNLHRSLHFPSRSMFQECFNHSSTIELKDELLNYILNLNNATDKTRI